MSVKKIKAVVLGHAVADALGVPVEFATRAELEQDPVSEMLGFGTYPVPMGSFSDDTSMSLAALDSLSQGKIDFDDVMLKLGAWYYEGAYTPTGEVFDVGNTCSFAIENYFSAHKSVDECGLSGEGSNGNGSLMRIHPFVLFLWAKKERSDWENIIDKASALTHAHERAKLGCKIYAMILWALLEENSKDAVRKALKDASSLYAKEAEYPHYARVFSPEFEHLPKDKIKSGGYVVDTLEAAVYCLLTTESYRECVLKAVNLGDDTDTVAAVAGGLAGALYGYDAIPSEWLAVLRKKDDIVHLCDALL